MSRAERNDFRKRLLRWLCSRTTGFTARQAARLVGGCPRNARRVLSDLTDEGIVVDVGVRMDGAFVYESAISWRRMEAA